MEKDDTFQEKSYSKHADHYKQYAQGGDKAEHARTWFNNDTVNAWRHLRMYQSLDPILSAESNASWLTVGDGRYGSDARYIMDNGGNAIASDISGHLLEEAKGKGIIENYRVENAEALSFKDDEFDFSFCKESYHHFPRPMIALYEMLRVSKNGVVLIEPNDAYVIENLWTMIFRGLKNIIKILLGKNTGRHGFEDAGNYVFTVSRREMEKVALGLNYKVIAFKGLNDAYITGVENEKMSENGPLQKKVKRQIKVWDFLAKLKVFDYAILTVIIFKKNPSDDILEKLTAVGYQITKLPDNPHIKS